MTEGGSTAAAAAEVADAGGRFIVSPDTNPGVIGATVERSTTPVVLSTDQPFR